MTPALDPALGAVLRCALALLWLVAAQHKLRNPARFREALAGYQLIPAPFVRAFAAALAALELGLGLGLLAPATAQAAALATAALLALYAAAVAANLARGRRSIDCGCGARPQPLGEELVARNAVLVGVALLAALPATGRALGWLDAVTILGGAAALAALYAAVEAALANGVRSRALRVRA